ncbi:hypothetical protein [Tahibacter sp.]|uniref:hypothetical protein n=1 Tax=Tahibacter sp. TaxID=2056211 RepID=UPI0028C489DB|nr:hypothetical protein [Tahibacter sp.]
MKLHPILPALGLIIALALPAQAVYVNPQGTGQVLLFPYYSVNGSQSTLISVVNTKSTAKIARIRFREGYNARQVVDLNLVLGPNDTWTATVFALQQADGATILTRDGSCTSPDKPSWTAPFPGGGYQQLFFPFAYDAHNTDSGPTAITRTREGYVEVIEMAELGGALAAAASGPQPLNCMPFQQMGSLSADLLPPGGGLQGNFAIVDVADGTLFGGAATAIEDFSLLSLFNDFGTPPTLAVAVSRGGEVDATIPSDGGYTTLTYSTADFPAFGGPNAISALLMADSVFGAMSREAGVGSHTEWVLTSPTKLFYTDDQLLGVALGGPGARAPFEKTFGEGGVAGSCVSYRVSGFDREGRAVDFATDPGPAGALPQHALCYATNVVHFSNLPDDGATPLLGSRLGSKVWNPTPATETANVRLQLGVRSGSAGRNILPAGLRGPALRGLPVIGFEAVRYINGNVSPGLLANYTMATPLRADVACVDAAGVAIDCPSQ